MKKKLMLLLALCFAQMAQAKDYKLVIRNNGTSVKSNTEVKTDLEGETETIMVTPASDATVVTATVKDMNGTIVSQDAVPASVPDSYVLTTPNLPTGTILEIRDNKGIVYSNYVLK